MYFPTHTEDFIKNLYSNLQIFEPSQLNKFTIAKSLNIGLYQIDGFSEAVFTNSKSFIFINRNLSPAERWQEFGHEISHVLWHAGNQSKMPLFFRDYQEWKADLFALHFCVPTFMLESFKHVTVYEIMNHFNVEYEFAAKRFEMYKNKIVSGGYVKWHA